MSESNGGPDTITRAGSLEGLHPPVRDHISAIAAREFMADAELFARQAARLARLLPPGSDGRKAIYDAAAAVNNAAAVVRRTV